MHSGIIRSEDLTTVQRSREDGAQLGAEGETLTTGRRRRMADPSLSTVEIELGQEYRNMDGLTETPRQRDGVREKRGVRVCNNRKPVG